ncbi:Uncharacterised protein [Mycobacteroides abscessus subsp. bolletii]|uniref:hypothetical protein n=1 Tax=Mycobacteroides abscessus TaxID=36809 RepID=UPI0009A668A1|nr:hypothetical protein [Mycobacteroides abscessus]SKY97772.1 Uncharacterised protein [Mycobacteroides abscessus subsp. bolletii]
MSAHNFLEPAGRALTDQCRADSSAQLDRILDAHAQRMEVIGALDDAEQYLSFMQTIDAGVSSEALKYLLGEALMRLRRARTREDDASAVAARGAAGESRTEIGAIRTRFLAAIMQRGIAHATTWASILTWDEDDRVAVVRDEEGPGQPTHTVTLETIEAGLRRLSTGDLGYINPDRGDVDCAAARVRIQESTRSDGVDSELDSSDCHAVLQAGIFGEVRYA